MQRLLLTALLTVACTSGPPPGFSGGTGDRWTFPLLGPLEDGLLITPVTIDGRGPYNFVIDPDANVSVIDEQVVKDVKMMTSKGPHRLDESDTQHPRFYADVRGLEIGTLIIERRDAMIVKEHTYDANGRRIYGVIGRDVLADSLVFGVDREQGLGHLITVKGFKPPADAITIKYGLLPANIPNAQVQPVERRIVNGTVNGEPLNLHLDLGAPTSQLREPSWEAAKLTVHDTQSAVIDEVGTPRRITKVGVGDTVTVGAASASKIAFVPYEDKRFSEHQVHGTLGLDFFRPYTVWANWDATSFLLTRRTPVPVETRIARWESGALGKCKTVGCVTVRITDPLAGKQVDPNKPHPGVVLSVTRDEAAGGMDLEVVLEAKDNPALPRLAVNLNASSDRVLQHLKAEWVGVKLTVVDASPYPRACPNADGCVDLLAR